MTEPDPSELPFEEKRSRIFTWMLGPRGTATPVNDAEAEVVEGAADTGPAPLLGAEVPEAQDEEAEEFVEPKYVLLGGLGGA